MKFTGIVAALAQCSTCLVAALVLAGCPASHILPYAPKRRELPAAVAAQHAPAQPAPGSLYSPDQQAKLYESQRATQVGDLLTIRILERADAQRGASTDLARGGGIDAKVDAMLSLLAPKEVKAGLDSTFTGRGQTQRTERLETTITAQVVGMDPAGNLFVEGHKVVLVNEEEQHFYISGLVRPADVAPDNTVLSSQVAEMEIEFGGRGVMSDKQRPGWLHRGLDYISPF